MKTIFTITSTLLLVIAVCKTAFSQFLPASSVLPSTVIVDGYDQVRTYYTPKNTNNVVRFSLAVNKDITWWKGIKIFDKNNNMVCMLTTQDADQGPKYSQSFPVSIFGNKVRIEYWKAKTFGAHTLVHTEYEDLKSLQAYHLAFRWMNDKQVPPGAIEEPKIQNTGYATCATPPVVKDENNLTINPEAGAPEIKIPNTPSVERPIDPEVEEHIESVVVDINQKDYSGNTAFMRAAAEGNPTEMMRLKEAGANIGMLNNNGENALHLAVRNRNTEAIQYLLENDLDINEKNRAGESVLQIAIDQQEFTIAQNLVQAGADPNGTNALDQAIRSRETALVELLLSTGNIRTASGLNAAAAVNDAELFERLIDKGARVTDNAPIDEAVRNDNEQIVQLAIEHGGDVNYTLRKAVDYDNKKILMLALESGGDGELAWPYAVKQRDVALFNSCIEKYGANPNNALGGALRAQQLDMAEICLKASANPDPHIKDMVNYGNKEAVALLLDYNGDPNEALAASVDKGNVSIAQLAIEKNARVSSAQYIKTACTQKNQDMVILLLDNGAQPDDGLIEAVTVESESIVRELLARGANPNAGMLKAVELGSAQLVELLLSNGADGKNPTYIRIAATDGNNDIVIQLLEAGANPNNGFKAAVEQGHSTVVNTLLEANADASDPKLLKIAVEKNFTEVSDALIKAGTPVSYLQPDGSNLLHITCEHTNTTIARLLIEKGINVNKTNNQGLVPLHIATLQKSASLVKLLLGNGAEVNALSNDQNSPLHYASKVNDISTARLLINHGAELNKANSDGDFPLHLTVSHRNNVDFAGLLVDSGADLNARNAKDKTVRKVAKGRKLVKYLKEAGAEK